MALSVQQLRQACLGLEVYVDNRPVGFIEEHRNTFVFQYASGASDSDFVSLLMPVRATAYQAPVAGALPPVFDMNLPEGSLRRALVNRYGKVVENFNDLALLALVGRNTIGRLSFGAAHHDQPSQLDMDRLMDAHNADALLLQLYSSDNLLSGIAGVQPKVLASIGQDDIRKFSDAQAAGQDVRATFRADNVIVKTSAADTPWLAANEFYCLRAAHLSGITTPQSRLFKGGQILAVERFDREWKGADAPRRLGAEDFCALSGKLSDRKYDGSYERVGKTLQDFISPQHSLQGRTDLFHQLALACVLHNGDAHLKNFTLLYEPSADGGTAHVRLSPVYDVCTTNAYLSEDMLALTLGGSKRYPKLKTLLDFGMHHCGLSKEETGRILEQVAEGVRQAAGDLQEYAQLYPDFGQSVGRAMLRCWQAGLASIGFSTGTGGLHERL